MNDNEMLNSQLSELTTLDIGAVNFNEPLSQHNSWKIGGQADLFVEPETPARWQS